MNGICECGSCQGIIQHASDCAVHNMPAMPNGACTCNAITHLSNDLIELRNIREGITDEVISSGYAWTPEGVAEYIGAEIDNEGSTQDDCCRDAIDIIRIYGERCARSALANIKTEG